jgi:hypothetical protein
MRIVLGLSLLAGALFLAPDAAQAAPLALGDHATMSREFSGAVVEEVGRRARHKPSYRKRGYNWTYYPYWRPYQYRYWKYYYPYGGPLF